MLQQPSCRTRRVHHSPLNSHVPEQKIPPPLVIFPASESRQMEAANNLVALQIIRSFHLPTLRCWKNDKRGWYFLFRHVQRLTCSGTQLVQCTATHISQFHIAKTSAHMFLQDAASPNNTTKAGCSPTPKQTTSTKAKTIPWAVRVSSYTTKYIKSVSHEVIPTRRAHTPLAKEDHTHYLLACQGRSHTQLACLPRKTSHTYR